VFHFFLQKKCVFHTLRSLSGTLAGVRYLTLRFGCSLPADGVPHAPDVAGLSFAECVVASLPLPLSRGSRVAKRFLHVRHKCSLCFCSQARYCLQYGVCSRLRPPARFCLVGGFAPKPPCFLPSEVIGRFSLVMGFQETRNHHPNHHKFNCFVFILYYFTYIIT